MDPDGRVKVVADALEFPNGMAITQDGGTLLVAESLACRISAYDIDDDGNLANRRVWAEFAPRPSSATFIGALASGAVIPDGICLDVDGSLWIADSGGHRVLRIGAHGQLLDSIDCGDCTAYAVALGGEDNRSLFLCMGPTFGTYDPRIDVRGELWIADLGVGTQIR